LRSLQGTVVFLPDSREARFIGVTIPIDVLAEDIALLRQAFPDEAEGVRGKYIQRYGEEHHVTLINSKELLQIPPYRYEGVLGRTVQVTLLGLGVAKRGGESSFFVVCESIDLQEARADVSLRQYDFHITLGFTSADLHDIAKGRLQLV
jgi:hypothetical protein